MARVVIIHNISFLLHTMACICSVCYTCIRIASYMQLRTRTFVVKTCIPWFLCGEIFNQTTQDLQIFTCNADVLPSSRSSALNGKATRFCPRHFSPFFLFYFCYKISLFLLSSLFLYVSLCFSLFLSFSLFSSVFDSNSADCSLLTLLLSLSFSLNHTRSLYSRITIRHLPSEWYRDTPARNPHSFLLLHQEENCVMQNEQELMDLQ